MKKKTWKYVQRSYRKNLKNLRANIVMLINIESSFYFLPEKKHIALLFLIHLFLIYIEDIQKANIQKANIQKILKLHNLNHHAYNILMKMQTNEENVAAWPHSVFQNNIVVFLHILYWKYIRRITFFII